MKWIWNLVGKSRKLIHKEDKLNPCKFHDERLYPDLLANHHCKSCEMELCYMCAHSHIDHGCNVKWPFHLQHSGNSLIDAFNSGRKTLLHWSDIKCTCGKPWTHGSEPTICIACANATCSPECHIKLQEQNVCLFYTNFAALDIVFETVNGFRAILHKNFQIAKQGQRVTYASPRFMSAFKHDENHILLQRGFRQYGQPLEEMTKNMSVIEEKTSYEHAMCLCNCEVCSQNKHPAYNCISTCQHSKNKKLKHVECWCLCSECIVRGAHSRKDCYHTCKLQKLENDNNLI
ncbi:unnamed protein product [Blepharisma stoltei]|uniref:Uncharacterized protein n=1 Tax=Blepharisma stoltei TaxID=1481888 RepID=A0AAU9IMA8_9CILI|nr:unnamed protein product [Blepharisma stoltei]